MRNAAILSIWATIGVSASLAWLAMPGPSVPASSVPGSSTTASQNPAAEGLDRTSLPIKEPERLPITELDVRNAKAPPRFEVKAPAGAPTYWLC